MMPNTPSHPKKGNTAQEPDHQPPHILSRVLSSMEPTHREIPPKASLRNGIATPTSSPDTETAEEKPRPVPQESRAPASSREEESERAPVIKETPLPAGGPSGPKKGASPEPSPSSSMGKWVAAGFVAVVLLNLSLAAGLIYLLQARSERMEPSATPPESTTSPEFHLSRTPRSPHPDHHADTDPPTEPVLNTDNRDRVERRLDISKLVLCRSVSDFGIYDPIPDTRITARHLPHMQAYIEIDHPEPEPRTDERYVYRLTKDVKLYETRVGPAEPVLDTAVSLVVGGFSPRRDFHSAQTLQPTRRVAPGDYTLLVRVTDQVSGRTASRETSLVIHPD